MMEQVLVFADSLSWGIVPGTRLRLPFEKRWPGALELGLRASGCDVRIVEDCLNGRRTAWDDPFKPGRNGLTTVQQRIEACSPLALVIVMLGTNDVQVMHPHDAWTSAQGMAALVRAIRSAPIEPGMAIPPVLVVVPPLIGSPRGPIAPKFAGAPAKMAGFGEAYAHVAAELGCALFDSNEVTVPSRVDGVHLDADQHAALAAALAPRVTSLLAERSR